MRGSQITSTPWSLRSRISRPTPCFRAITALGSWSSAKGSPPLSLQSSTRALSSGSSGLANGSLSMITQESAAPRTSIPSQKLLVATSTARPFSTNSLSSRCLLSSPCNSTVRPISRRSTSATWRITWWLVQRKKQPPGVLLIRGIIRLANCSPRPKALGSGR